MLLTRPGRLLPQRAHFVVAQLPIPVPVRASDGGKCLDSLNQACRLVVTQLAVCVYIDPPHHEFQRGRRILLQLRQAVPQLLFLNEQVAVCVVFEQTPGVAPAAASAASAATLCVLIASSPAFSLCPDHACAEQYGCDGRQCSLDLHRCSSFAAPFSLSGRAVCSSGTVTVCASEASNEKWSALSTGRCSRGPTGRRGHALCRLSE